MSEGGREGGWDLGGREGEGRGEGIEKLCHLWRLLKHDITFSGLVPIQKLNYQRRCKDNI